MYAVELALVPGHACHRAIEKPAKVEPLCGFFVFHGQLLHQRRFIQRQRMPGKPQRRAVVGQFEIFSLTIVASPIILPSQM